MNSESPSLLAKILTAALGFGLMAAVPLLTMQYAVRAQAETPPHVAVTSCPGDCTAARPACPGGTTGCAQHPCASGTGCARN